MKLVLGLVMDSIFKNKELEMASEAREGEFTLVYNTEGKGHPVALTRYQHEKLQILINDLGGEIVVISSLVVETKKL